MFWKRWTFERLSQPHMYVYCNVVLYDWRHFVYLSVMSTCPQKVIPCRVAEMDAALQRCIKGSSAVVVCASTSQEAQTLLQVGSANSLYHIQWSLPILNDTHLPCSSEEFDCCCIVRMLIARSVAWRRTCPEVIVRDYCCKKVCPPTI